MCVVDGVLLAIGGADQDGSRKTSSIYGLHLEEKKWRHVGDLPFACSMGGHTAAVRRRAVDGGWGHSTGLEDYCTR